MKKLVMLLLLVASAAYGEIYTWKDARGTAFYTNSLHEIPSRYLSRAKVLDVATGKKSPLASAKPAGQTGPATAPVQPSVQVNPVPQPSTQQTPIQQAPAIPAAPATPAMANPVAPPQPAATAAETRQHTRAQRRARHRSEEE